MNQNSNQDDNYKTNVPINATMIGTLGTIITLVIAICAFNYFNDENMNGGPYSILIIVSTIHLPLVLTLTIKHHKKTRKIGKRNF